LAIISLIILIPIAFILPGKGIAVDVTVAPTQVTLGMNLSLQENITNLPLVNINLDSSSSKSIADQFTPALQRLVPGATVASLSLHARTVNSTGTWLLMENYTLTITGANTNSGSSVKSDTGFVSMNVGSGINDSGLELNKIGKTYFLSILTSQPENTAYFINGSPTLNAAIPAQTTLVFSLLDFSWVPAVSTWSRQDDILGQSTVWRYNPDSPIFNLTFGPKSPEGPLIRTFTAVYNPAFQLNVPANAWAVGTTVYFDLPTPSELLMPVIIVLSVVILAAALYFDRSLSKIQRFRAKRASLSVRMSVGS